MLTLERRRPAETTRGLRYLHAVATRISPFWSVKRWNADQVNAFCRESRVVVARWPSLDKPVAPSSSNQGPYSSSFGPPEEDVDFTVYAKKSLAECELARFAGLYHAAVHLLRLHCTIANPQLQGNTLDAAVFAYLGVYVDCPSDDERERYAKHHITFYVDHPLAEIEPAADAYAVAADLRWAANASERIRWRKEVHSMLPEAAPAEVAGAVLIARRNGIEAARDFVLDRKNARKRFDTGARPERNAESDGA